MTKALSFYRCYEDAKTESCVKRSIRRGIVKQFRCQDTGHTQRFTVTLLRQNMTVSEVKDILSAPRSSLFYNANIDVANVHSADETGGEEEVQQLVDTLYFVNFQANI